MIKFLTLENFRNINDTELSFAPTLNIIFGENAFGKSNILEAIFLCGFGRSFRGYGQPLIRFDKEFAHIVGTDENRNVVEIFLRLDGNRNVLFNNKRLIRITELLGKFPTTYIGPQEVMVVAGSPSVRRALLDTHLCQLDVEYAENLLAYERAMRQRNASLRGISEGTMAGGVVLIDAWDEKISAYGTILLKKRVDFIRKLSVMAMEIFSAICGEDAYRLSIKYKSTIADNLEIDDLAALFMEKLAKIRKIDLLKFETTIGPHRDDVEIMLGNFAARLFASWGQVRIISLALYLGAARVLAEQTAKVPALLLDDALAELDPRRAKMALDIIPNIGQAFVATPHPEQIKNVDSGKIFTFLSPGNIVENKMKE